MTPPDEDRLAFKIGAAMGTAIVLLGAFVVLVGLALLAVEGIHRLGHLV